MLLKENAMSGTIRGYSVAAKKSYTSGLRSIVPKFLRDIADSQEDRKKNAHEPTITVLTKENIKPQFVSVEPNKESKPNNRVSVIKKAQLPPLQILPRGLHNIGNSCYMYLLLDLGIQPSSAFFIPNFLPKPSSHNSITAHPIRIARTQSPINWLWLPKKWH